MNNIVESGYVLHLWWSYIRCKIDIKSLKYMILPFLYIFIILLVLPNKEMVVNKINNKKLDTYITTNISKEDKKKEILKNYNLSQNEFDILVSIVLAEAEANSYEDAYAVINTIYNRTHSKNWIASVSNNFGSNKGKSLYYQAIQPNQFVVYQNGSYKRHLNKISSVGYEAIIDFLYNEKIMHNYLSFRANNIKVKDGVTFSQKGNKYFNELKEENRL